MGQFMKETSIMQKRILSVFIAALSLQFAIQPCMADEHHGAGGEHHDRGGFREFRGDRHEGFRGGDIRRFREHDFGIWHGGRWVHGPHGGRRGWWWIAGGIWYFYPAPIYPYPDPYLPPVAELPAPAATQYWYYCNDPPGYYPYVPQCLTQWQPVPANAPPPPQYAP
jgi:hypothetical protein